MLTSLGIIFLFGLLLGAIFNKFKLPSLVGMMIAGMIISPYGLNLLDASILEMSSQLRQFALVIILTRAGLSLDITKLKQVGRPAILICFVPACFEILGVMIIAPKLLGLTLLEAAIMGSVLAAVSPAIIVPRMIKIMEAGYGVKKSIPQMILAGASVDDVFVIVLFTSFTSLADGEGISVSNFLQVPASIILGIVIGSIIGFLLLSLYKRVSMRDSLKVLIILSISFLLLELQNMLNHVISISALLAIMSTGIVIFMRRPSLAERLSAKYNGLWVAAEVILFVLVGATIDLRYTVRAGGLAIVVVLVAMVFRMVGVSICMWKSKLTSKERIFCMVAYIPKATVQAAIGAIPLSMGLLCGQQVLMVAVIAILMTAPLGAVCVDKLYRKLLVKS